MDCLKRRPTWNKMVRISILWVLLVSVLFAGALTKTNDDYDQHRRALLLADQERSFCSDIVLNQKEQLVDRYLGQLVWEIERETREEGVPFPAAQPFYEAQGRIESSDLFFFLRRMPKGGLLHVHTSSTGSADWIVNEAAQRKDCYVYWPTSIQQDPTVSFGTLTFFYGGPVPPGYDLVSNVRARTPDFDEKLHALITFGPEEERVVDIWQEFSRCFQRVYGFLSNLSVFDEYYYQAFKALGEDNVQYVELRAGIDPLYKPDGTKIEGWAVIDRFQQIRDRVRDTCDPNFDLKLIISGHRSYSTTQMEADIQQAIKWYREQPYQNFVIGYDLVGEEDTGHTTYYYASTFLKYLGQIPFYFHDGESDWATDVNLFDAYLLESRRVGHGFNLFYFQDLQDSYKEKDIALEVCPLSNQLLHYVKDLRTHPAAGYLKNGLQCTINSDDPGIFDYIGLTYDFWIAASAWHLDLRGLKKLILNSFAYSGMTESEKVLARAVWETRWNAFIDDIVEEIEAASSST